MFVFISAISLLVSIGRIIDVFNIGFISTHEYISKKFSFKLRLLKGLTLIFIEKN